MIPLSKSNRAVRPITATCLQIPRHFRNITNKAASSRLLSPVEPARPRHEHSHASRILRSVSPSLPQRTGLHCCIASSSAYISTSTATATATSTSTMPATFENAWIGYKGAAGYDLRSDTQTTPTPSMLAAIAHTTLLDDVYEEDPTTIDLEAHVAALCGKEAGLLVLSGTMGNQVALRTLLTQPPHSVLCDHRSHINKYEAGGVAALSGAQLECVRPSNGVHLTLEDVQEAASVEPGVHYCPTRVISLENTLNGMLMPLSEAQRISQWAREKGIKMHCDGARLWEAAASGAGTMKEFAACFDTLSLCFSKGLGAPIGSILVGPKDVIKHARWIRQSIGGGLRQSGVVAAAARVAVDETFGTDPTGEDGLLRKSHEMAKTVEKLWMDLGGKVVYPVHTNMVWIDLKEASSSDARLSALGKEHGLLISGRIVCHYQIYQNREVILPKLESIFKTIFEEKSTGAAHNENGAKTLYK